jgi:hypothetical protein
MGISFVISPNSAKKSRPKFAPRKTRRIFFRIGVCVVGLRTAQLWVAARFAFVVKAQKGAAESLQRGYLAP